MRFIVYAKRGGLQDLSGEGNRCLHMRLTCRCKEFRLITAFICAACGTIATPMPTPSLEPRPVAITVQPDSGLAEQRVFDPEFAIDVEKGRGIEGLCVWTGQWHYWEPGDRTETAQPHRIEVTVDDKQVISRDQLFVFWNNASIQEVYDDDGNSIGSYLAAPMHICFNTRNMSLGSHHAQIEITSTSGVVHNYSWGFELTSITRTEIDPSLELTAEYLLSNPAPTPSFVQRAPTAVAHIDGFVCETSFNEALLIVVGQEAIAEINRGPLTIQIAIDEILLSSESVQIMNTDYNAYLICADTGYFERGTHTATLQLISLSGVEQSYSWAFRIP